jgi:hypothetical protein
VPQRIFNKSGRFRVAEGVRYLELAGQVFDAADSLVPLILDVVEVLFEIETSFLFGIRRDRLAR